MEREGFDTIFFSIKRHPPLLAQSLAIAYAYMDDKLFARLQPEDKSLLWNSEGERLSFYRQLFDDSHPDLLQKFMADPVFDEWNKVCIRALKRTHTPTEQY
jgi:hypothetical protein